MERTGLDESNHIGGLLAFGADDDVEFNLVAFAQRHSRIGFHAVRFIAKLAARIRMAMPDNVLIKDKNILGGAPVFRKTRVPFQALLDYLEGGQTLDDFLKDFPTVSRETAIAALEEAKALVVSRLG